MRGKVGGGWCECKKRARCVGVGRTGCIRVSIHIAMTTHAPIARRNHCVRGRWSVVVGRWRHVPRGAAWAGDFTGDHCLNCLQPRRRKVACCVNLTRCNLPGAGIRVRSNRCSLSRSLTRSFTRRHRRLLPKNLNCMSKALLVVHPDHGGHPRQDRRLVGAPALQRLVAAIHKQLPVVSVRLSVAHAVAVGRLGMAHWRGVWQQCYRFTLLIHSSCMREMSQMRSRVELEMRVAGVRRPSRHVTARFATE